MESELMISVIVPVYNGEKFIRRAVDSVLCQMDGRIELILVDDGSKDSSGAICDEYALKNPDIHVIHKTNGGTSSAKNMGIEAAKGRYISFMDCDDFLDPDTYATIIPILLEQQPDCLDFGWKYIGRQGETSEALHQCRKNTLLPLQELEDVILPPLLNLRKDDAHFVYDFAWNKVFKGEIIRANHVRFDEDKKTWEDRTFLLRHLKYCKNYYCLDQCFYNYVYVPNSLSQRYSLDFFKIILANFNHYRELFEDRFDFDTQYVRNYWARAIENMIFRSLEQKDDRETIRNNMMDILKNEQVIYWFAKRTPESDFDQQISKLIEAGKLEQALNSYEKRMAQNRRRKAVVSMKHRIKRGIRKIVRR